MTWWSSKHVFDGKNVKETEIPADMADLVEEHRAPLLEAAAEYDDEALIKSRGRGAYCQEVEQESRTDSQAQVGAGPVWFFAFSSRSSHAS